MEISFFKPSARKIHSFSEKWGSGVALVTVMSDLVLRGPISRKWGKSRVDGALLGLKGARL